MVKILSWAKYGGGVHRVTKSYYGANWGAPYESNSKGVSDKIQCNPFAAYCDC